MRETPLKAVQNTHCRLCCDKLAMVTFLALPRELRDMILEGVLLDDLDTTNLLMDCWISEVPPYGMTCCQLLTEVRQMTLS
jgi:hypothetical protein